MSPITFATPAKLAIVAFIAAIICFAVVSWLPGFEPCRAFYYVRNPVQDSLQCQLFVAMEYGGFALLTGSGIAAIVAGYWIVRRRWGGPNRPSVT
jgi:hypothetical protein